eukprot:1156485-Pelagomonas_calceolata.AAC.3
MSGVGRAVKTMKEGEHVSLLIQPQYAYGALGRDGLVPPNAAVEVDLELVSWKKVSASSLYGPVVHCLASLFFVFVPPWVARVKESQFFPCPLAQPSRSSNGRSDATQNITAKNVMESSVQIVGCMMTADWLQFFLCKNEIHGQKR